MDHVAIDLGGKESQICIRRSDGTISHEERCATTSLKARLARLAPSRVVLETCAEAFVVASWARQAGHDVVVVPSSLAKSLGVGSRGVKNDVRDARNLSEASCRMSSLPRVHVPAQPTQELKALCTLRESLVSARTKLINCVRGWLRTQGIGTPPRGNADAFTKRIATFYKNKTGAPLPAAIQRHTRAIDCLTEQMLEAEAELESSAKADPVCRRLMTVPGVGPLVAIRFFCAVDDVSRFDSAQRLQSYLGLTPGESSSSDTKRMTGITKAGAPRVRWILQQAAWTAWRCRPSDPMVVWALELSKRRGRKVAATALARKIAGILFAIWRDDSRYQPSRGATSSSAPPATAIA